MNMRTKNTVSGPITNLDTTRLNLEGVEAGVDQLSLSALNLLGGSVDRAAKIHTAYLDLIAENTSSIVENSRKVFGGMFVVPYAFDSAGKMLMRYVET